MALRDTRTVRGAQKLGQRIRTIRTRTNLPAMVDDILELLHRRTMSRFAREVTPDNEPWLPLAEYTLRRKKQLGYGNKQKLVRTDTMRRSIKVIRGRADGGIFVNTGAGGRIGITDPKVAEYANKQNKGSEHIPARQFLGIGRLDIKSVDSFLRRRATQLDRDLRL